MWEILKTPNRKREDRRKEDIDEQWELVQEHEEKAREANKKRWRLINRKDE